MSKSKNNPNKANQYIPDPRQGLFLAYYLNPKSKTFSNAYQSAVRARYSKEYAEVLTGQMPTWLSEMLSHNKMLSRAERNLLKYLEMQTKQPVITMIGPLIDKKTKKPILKENTNLLKIQADISKFVAERLGKKHYSIRTELTGEEGGELPFKIIIKKSNEANRNNQGNKPVSPAV